MKARKAHERTDPRQFGWQRPLVQVQSLRPNKAENEPFSALFFAFSGQNRAFSHHFRTTRNSEIFLTTYLTTVGAEANRLVASAPVRSAHEKRNSKGSRRYSLREPFSLFTAYQNLKGRMTVARHSPSWYPSKKQRLSYFPLTSFFKFSDSFVKTKGYRVYSEFSCFDTFSLASVFLRTKSLINNES